MGSFRKGMEVLKARGMDDAICKLVTGDKVKILGICLGMQLLGSYGTEEGETEGLGLVPNGVEKFTGAELGKMKIPHVGRVSKQRHCNDENTRPSSGKTA